MRSWQRWLPGGILASGCLLNTFVVMHRSGPVPLRAPIETVAPQMLGTPGVDQPISDDERRVAGMSSFVLRNYAPATGLPFSIYVGYYDEQHQGKSIHSPKNCLPGSGWEAVQATTVTIQTANGPAVVNRYRIVNEAQSAIVYYWYQGRGRIAHGEFRVKYELLRDAAIYGRTEEALVRIVVPIVHDDVAGADRVATAVAAPLAADVDRVLPRL
ncbi:MAG TPA: EpsI family protein [Gemmatimonadales bacterium]|jgi:EpsI family protein|nr:EpsI family protein [Gemmatimonadales bacterium]